MIRKKSIDLIDDQYRSLVGDAAYNDKNVTIKSITKDYSEKFDTLQVCFLSDLHIGSSDFDIKGLIETLQYANSQENAVIFILGDALNTAIVGSKSDSYEDILSPQEQLDVFSKVLVAAKGDTEIMKIIQNLNDSGKIIVLHNGNHEDRIRKAVGVSTTKLAADIAGVGDVFAPYFASTDLVLRQPLAADGKFTFKILTHHGTGISNVDGVFRLLRNVDNADMCVIGHTHQQSMKVDRLIDVDENGQQYYHDVLCLTLPASGGGTYGAGMSMPDICKQTAVWMAISSQPNPHAGKLSPTGISYKEITPACAFFTPTLSMETFIQQKRIKSAKKAISDVKSQKFPDIIAQVDELLESIAAYEESIRRRVKKRISEKPKKEPEGFREFLALKLAITNTDNPDDNNNEPSMEEK